MRVSLVQGSDEWMSWRRGKISASMMSSIMGVNPWKSRNKLWKQVLGILPDEEQNHHMARGQKLEPIVRGLVEERLLEKFPAACFQHDHDEWAIASLDGINSTGDTILEVKCPSKKDTCVPTHYNCQIQWQLYVSGARKCHYASFTDDELSLFVVMRDDEMIEKLRKEAQLFRQQLRDLEEPEVDDSDCEELHDEEAIRLQIEYEELDREAKSFAARRDLIRLRLINLANGRNLRIGNLVISKSRKPGAVQYEKIPELRGVDLDYFRKPASDFYRITRKK